MKMSKQVKSKSLLILTAAVIVLSLGFIVSCGIGPQQKIDLLDEGNYAVDLSSASEYDANNATDLSVCDSSADPLGEPQACYKLGAVWNASGNKDLPPSLAGTELTIEAMIKNKVASDATDDTGTAWDETKLNGGIFSFYDSGGVMMWVKNNEPKFGIRIPGTRPTDCGVAAKPTISCDPSTQYTVSSGAASEVASGNWTHVAGVLVNEVHSHTETSSCTATAMAETPHLDIYINGQFKDCASSGFHFAVNPTYTVNKERIGVGQLIAIKPTGEGGYWKEDFNVDSLDATTRFNGVIDEVRLWTVARTADEIDSCWNRELGLEGSCARTSDLKIYWRFNEKEGALVHDFSGNAFNGSKNEIILANILNSIKAGDIESSGYPSSTPSSWSYGWTTGYPF